MRYQPTECILSEDKLRERCAEWQTALYLSDWSVALAVVRARDMELTNNQGECEWTRSTRLANVRLLDPADFPPGPWPYDMEAVLVHELLHLHFAPFAADDRPDGPDGIAQEQAIESMARALVALKRACEGETRRPTAADALAAILRGTRCLRCGGEIGPGEPSFNYADGSRCHKPTCPEQAAESDTTITVHQDPGFTVQSGDGNTGEAFVPKGWGPSTEAILDRVMRPCPVDPQAANEWARVRVELGRAIENGKLRP